MTPSIRGEKRQKTKDAMTSAYLAYKNNKAGSLTVLLGIIKKFAIAKMYDLEIDFVKTGTAETVDDWAQEVLIRVWQGLEGFSGVPESFYPWVHKIIFNRSTHAFNMLDDERSNKLSLTVTGWTGDDAKIAYDQENPEIYKSLGGYEGYITIPDSIQGVDLDICKLMIAGTRYEQIGEELGLTCAAVKQRMSRLRKRMEAERKASKAAIEAEKLKRAPG